jgi:signal peptidase I
MSRPTRKSVVREYTEAIVWAVALTLFLRAFVIQAFRIPSGSMMDTLLIGDFLFVNKFEYGPKIPFTDIRLPGLRKPQTGDVIVFQWPVDPSKDFIKRCIATGGQTLEGREREVLLDGRTLAEPYVRHLPPAELHGGSRDTFGPVTVEPGRLFMMGDNRDDSNDSRFWGTVPMDYVKGRAMFIYFSTAGDQWWNGFLNIRFDRLFRPIR